MPPLSLYLTECCHVFCLGKTHGSSSPHGPSGLCPSCLRDDTLQRDALFVVDVDTLNTALLTTNWNPYTCHLPRGRITLHWTVQLKMGVSEENPVFAKTSFRSPKGARHTWQRGDYLLCSKEGKVAGETSGHLDHHGTLGHYHKRHSRGGEAIFKLSPSPCFTGQGQDALPDGRGTGGQERTAQRRPDADVGTPRRPLRWDANVLSSAKERLNTLLLRSQDWGGVSLTLFKVYENIWMCKCHWLCASNRLWLYEKSVF